jgi:hypothetical protein
MDGLREASDRLGVVVRDSGGESAGFTGAYRDIAQGLGSVAWIY